MCILDNRQRVFWSNQTALVPDLAAALGVKWRSIQNHLFIVDYGDDFSVRDLRGFVTLEDGFRQSFVNRIDARFRFVLDGCCRLLQLLQSGVERLVKLVFFDGETTLFQTDTNQIAGRAERVV